MRVSQKREAGFEAARQIGNDGSSSSLRGGTDCEKANEPGNFHGWKLAVNGALAWGLDKPIVESDTVFEEREGLVAVEAEFFTSQTKTDVRRWYRTSATDRPRVGRDPDGPHLANASNNAYLEILPDTRTNHDDKLTAGENFSNEAGTMAVLNYPVYFHTPGRYYVWVRAHFTGSEDNGIHVGIDGTWPETGQRMQWCEGKRTWRWESKQRTEKSLRRTVPALSGCGRGASHISFSMRDKTASIQTIPMPLIGILCAPAMPDRRSRSCRVLYLHRLKSCMRTPHPRQQPQWRWAQGRTGCS